MFITFFLATIGLFLITIPTIIVINIQKENTKKVLIVSLLNFLIILLIAFNPFVFIFGWFILLIVSANGK